MEGRKEEGKTRGGEGRGEEEPAHLTTHPPQLPHFCPLSGQASGNNRPLDQPPGLTFHPRLRAAVLV